MKLDGKDVLLWASLFLIGAFLGGGFGFLAGAWGGTINGYDEGVNAGINYSNCVVEETPLYSVITQEVINECWERHVYDS